MSKSAKVVLVVPIRYRDVAMRPETLARRLKRRSGQTQPTTTRSVSSGRLWDFYHLCYRALQCELFGNSLKCPRIGRNVGSLMPTCFL